MKKRGDPVTVLPWEAEGRVVTGSDLSNAIVVRTLLLSLSMYYRQGVKCSHQVC